MNKNELILPKQIYDGWELEFFDNAKKFRNYQFQLINNHISGNVAEVGPGNGEFLKFYRDYSKNIFLFEPSGNFLKSLNKLNKNRITVINDYFGNSPFTFDTILYMDVLEHINDDKGEIKKAYDSLNDNGKLIVNVPAFNILFSQFDIDVGHYRRYNKKLFLEKVNELNFKSIEMVYYDSVGFFLSFVSKILIKNYRSNFNKKIKLWDMLIPISKILDKVFFNSFGKSLLIICKK